MTTTKVRYASTVALAVADELRALLAPACERIEIAGSLRRGNGDVGDIELVCIPRPLPKSEERQALAMFAALAAPDVGALDALDLQLRALIARGTLRGRLGARGRPIGYGPLNKYLVHSKSAVPVDVFTATGANFGFALFVRTGSKDWNIRAMKRLQALGLRGHVEGYRITSAEGNDLPVPDEAAVFALLQADYVRPERRR